MSLTLEVLQKQLGLDVDPNVLSKIVSGIDNLITAGTLDLAKGSGKILETAGDVAQNVIPEVRVGGKEMPSALSAARYAAGKVSDGGETIQNAADAHGAVRFPKDVSMVDAVEKRVVDSEKDATPATADGDDSISGHTPKQKEILAQWEAERNPNGRGESGMTYEEIAATNARGDAIDAEVADLPTEKAPPKAVVVDENPIDPKHAAALFRTAHGGEFDPKSSMDKRKMAEIESMLQDPANQSLTPNQFALKLYRGHGYV